MVDSPTLVLQVAAKAVIIDNNDKVLILREGTTGKNNTQIGNWGLVGGRLEPAETFLDALHREIKEETGLRVEPLRPIYIGEWRPTIRGVPHQIIAVFMLCRASSTDVTLSTEHDAHEWIDPEQYTEYSMMDPDDQVIEALITTTNSTAATPKSSISLTAKL